MQVLKEVTETDTDKVKEQSPHSEEVLLLFIEKDLCVHILKFFNNVIDYNYGKS